MKNRIVIALLALIVLFQSAVIYNDKQIIRKMAQDHADKHTREMMEGYERCIASVDEAKFTNHTDDAVWLKARQGCRDFWFLGKP